MWKKKKKKINATIKKTESGTGFWRAREKKKRGSQSSALFFQKGRGKKKEGEPELTEAEKKGRWLSHDVDKKRKVGGKRELRAEEKPAQRDQRPAVRWKLASPTWEEKKRGHTSQRKLQEGGAEGRV